MICVALASAAALVLLCSGRLNGGAKPEVRPLEELQGNYSLNDAIADGCFVIEDGSVTNLDVLERFVQDAERGDPAFLRKYEYTSLTIDSSADPGYYESVKGDYPEITVEDIVFDKGIYSVRSCDEDGELTVREFPYLVRDHFDYPNQYSATTGGTAYFLCERDDVSTRDVLNLFLSGQFADFPDFRIICLINEYKDDMP